LNGIAIAVFIFVFALAFTMGVAALQRRGDDSRE
jgi:hypothetical protein